jgi:diaminopimelate decarboxylase
VRVAVIGAGPKGLFATERLLARRGTGPLEVVVFDPREPGTGAAYGRAQPDWLRLNVTSAIVDAGWRTGPCPSPAWLVGFDDWPGAAGSPGGFAPRHLVGRYLDWVWRGLQATAGDGATLAHRRRQVTALTPAGPAWSVHGERFDEVLLATGHADDWDGALRHRWRGPERLVPAVFPLTGLEGIAAGASVAVRGAALTFLDAALALTEGRGGRFTGDGPLQYRRSGAEPGVVWPTSRTGRWMEVKPEPGSALAALDRAAAVAAATAAVAAAESSQLALAEVGRLAGDLLVLVGASGSATAGGDGVAAVLSGAAGGDPTDGLRRSWEVATGRRVPSAAWAVGQAWRDLYPALTRRFGGVDAPEAFGAFAGVAATLERVAFGPPPGNAAKLLALIDAGLVDPAALTGAVVDEEGFQWRSGAGPAAAVVVDAVLPPPGVAHLPASLPGRLVAAGLIVRAPGRRGVAIDSDGTCLAPDGTRRRGLAALGRPTEDVTIGNDTLNRSLHDTADRWAARVTTTRTAR